VSDVKHSNNVCFNREQDAINVRLSPVQELPHFELDLAIFGSERAAGGTVPANLSLLRDRETHDRSVTGAL